VDEHKDWSHENVMVQLIFLEHHPVWPANWVDLMKRLKAFHAQCSEDARAAGWSLTDLYGLDANTPYVRLSRWGGGFLAALPNRTVLSVDAKAIRILTTSGARQSIYRPEPGGVLAWELAG
jgi:hypothetical protein